MSCPICQPQRVTAAICDEVFGRAADQLTNPDNCIRHPSNNETYCPKDKNDGTHYIESSTAGAITAPFSTGYNTKIALVTGGNETIYVSTQMNELVCYAVTKFNAGDPLQNSLWKEIKDFPIPYDYDFLFHDGCGGTDWFFQDDPIMMTAKYGALFIGDYILTPDVALKRRGNGYEIECHKEEIKRLLECALQSSTDANTARQIQSALLMLDTAECGPFTTKGPHIFNNANISKTVELGDVNISSSRKNLNGPVTAINVAFSPHGIGNDNHFTINRLGMLFVYYRKCFRKVCVTKFIREKVLDPEDKNLYIQMLDQLLETDLNPQDEVTVRQVRDILLHPNPPPWAWKNP